MFSKRLCTLIRSILYDNKSRALPVSVGQILVRSSRRNPIEKRVMSLKYKKYYTVRRVRKKQIVRHLYAKDIPLHQMFGKSLGVQN